MANTEEVQIHKTKITEKNETSFFSVTQISFPVSDISIFNIQDIQYCFN